MTVEPDPQHRRLRITARADIGDNIVIGPGTIEIAPRIFDPGDDPPESQSSGPSDGKTHIAPMNVSVRPRVGSPGNDGDRHQENSHPSQIAAVNADVSPRIFSDGNSGDRTQDNGGSEAAVSPAPGTDQPQPAPDGPPPVPLVAAVVEAVRPSRGRRGALDIVAINADLSPRLGSKGNDGNRSQRNGWDAPGTNEDQVLAENQIVAGNVLVAPDILSPGDDGDVNQWNGHGSQQNASATNGNATTGAGSQTLFENQVAPINAAITTDVLSDGNDGSVTQRNGSVDGQSASVINNAGPGGTASTGSGDQVITDGQVLPVNLLLGGNVISNGNDGDTWQQNGSDDDQVARTQNGPGAGGNAETGSGSQTLTDLQVAPIALALAPDVASKGNSGSTFQHNGSDDDQAAYVDNAGPDCGGNGSTGAGDEVLTDAQVLPVTLESSPAIGATGDHGSVTQHNGSDDDQLVIVHNGVGAAGNGTTGDGSQTLTDLQVVPVTGSVSPDLGSTGNAGAVSEHNGSDDDQEVHITNAGAAGGDGATGAGDELLADAQVVPVSAVVSPPIGATGDRGPVTEHNGSDDDQLVTVDNGVGADGNGTTGAGGQTGSDLQVAPVIGDVSPDLGSKGNTGPTSQHNGSDDDQEVQITNAGATGGDGATGAGDQTLTDLQVAPTTASVSPTLGATGDNGGLTQHNGSDDDQLVTVDNGVGADGNGTTGAGGQTLTDLQVVPVAGELSPGLGSTGTTGPTTQHNGSDDDQEVRITNAGQSGGDGTTGAGGQTGSDEQIVPVTGAINPPLGGGDHGPTNQQNGSDDDQLVVVTNGPGADGNGTAGQGPQSGSDDTAVPVPVGSDNPQGTDDDVEVDVIDAQQVLAVREHSPRGRNETTSTRRRGGSDGSGGSSTGSGGGASTNSGGGGPGPNQPLGSTGPSVLGATAHGTLPRTGFSTIPAALLGLLSMGGGALLRRRTRRDEETKEGRTAG